MNDKPNNEEDGVSAERARCGVVAVVGRTNSGKSTLINGIVGEKVSIVSPVSQTTRGVIRAVFTDHRGQIVILDTPGLHQSKGSLGNLMNRMAMGSVADVDLILLMVDASRPPLPEDESWMRTLTGISTPVVLVLNKSDVPTFRPAPYLERVRSISVEKKFAAIPRTIEISATTGKGTDGLIHEIFERLPLGPALFDTETLTDYPRRLAIADVVREKFYGFLRDELPHDIGVCVNDIVESESAWEISVDIYVERSSQKPILLGLKGRNLRRVRRQAEPELSHIFHVPVTLKLWIKVEHHWKRNFWLLRKMGYAGR